MGEVGGRSDFTPDWATSGPQGELYFPSGWVAEQLPEAVFLCMGAERDGIDLSKIGQDAEITAIFCAGCEAMNFIASKVSAYEVYTDAQRAGLAVGVIFSPDEAYEAAPFRERGFLVEVHHRKLVRASATPWRLPRCSTASDASRATSRGSLSTPTRCCEKSENPEARELRARRVA